MTFQSSLKSTQSLPGLRHTTRFHTDPQYDLSTYTVFHGPPDTSGSGHLPPYCTGPITNLINRSVAGARADGFSATAQKFVGLDGSVSYKWGHHSALGQSTGKRQTGTLNQTAPRQYKSFMTEYVDEYRECKEHLATQRMLTTRYNTLGGTMVTKRSTRSDGQPNYETRVKAF